MTTIRSFIAALLAAIKSTWTNIRICKMFLLPARDPNRIGRKFIRRFIDYYDRSNGWCENFNSARGVCQHLNLACAFFSRLLNA
jgi:hypothetical protein